jgi:hypothetical protein
VPHIQPWRRRAVFVQKAALENASCAGADCITYKLAPIELRVLLEVGEVGVVADVARALGVSEATVKTHLQRVFVKTATRPGPNSCDCGGAPKLRSTLSRCELKNCDQMAMITLYVFALERRRSYSALSAGKSRYDVMRELVGGGSYARI